MAFVPLSAKDCKVRWTGKVLTAKKWTLKYNADKLDVSNFEGAGFKSYTGGLVGLDCTIEFDYSAENPNMFDTAGLDIGPGFEYDSVVLYTNDTTSAHWDIGLFVDNVDMSADVKGLLTCTITGSASGTFNRPSGTSSSLASDVP